MASFEVEEGQVVGFVLETAGDGPRRVERRRVLAVLDGTVGFWRSWLAGSTYRGRWREMVNRSAITLKLLTYAPTGALSPRPPPASPSSSAASATGTTATPGSATRRSRSGPCSASASPRRRRSSSAGSATGRANPQAADGAVPLKIMYRVDGSSDLVEETLDHFERLQGIAPGADRQRRCRPDPAGHLRRVRRLRLSRPTGWVRCPPATKAARRSPGSSTGCAENWDQPDAGIWETRGGRQAFTYGRVMCWVAFDRGIRQATKYGRGRAPTSRGGRRRARPSTSRS